MDKWKLIWSKLLPLNAENISAIPADVSGVYRLSKKEGDKIYVFYVGQGNIRERLLIHISDQEPNECVKATKTAYACYFRYSIIMREEVRKAAESKMFKFYQPECNTKVPEGRDDIIDVNLEPV